MSPNHRLILLMLCCTCIFACKKQPVVERGFYYWKSETSHLDENEIDLLQSTNTQKLYVKFFEVEFDKNVWPVPVEKMNLRIFSDYYSTNEFAEFKSGGKLEHMQIIPVIFIRNVVLSNSNNEKLDELADNIVYLTKKYYGEKFTKSLPPMNELQLDCDWTANTKENYFYLIKKVRELSKVKVSCTLRLYPFKYPEKMGIPPVDRATLMCYNLIGPFADEKRNSILDLNELESYLKDAKPYPVPLDFVLPAYSWNLLFQNNMFSGIMKEAITEGDSCFKQTSDLWYDVQCDKVSGNLFLRPGDRIKHESVSGETINGAIDLLNQYMEYQDTITISFFHLDELNLEHYGSDTINHFFSAVH